MFILNNKDKLMLRSQARVSMKFRSFIHREQPIVKKFINLAINKFNLRVKFFQALYVVKSFSIISEV